MPPAFNPMLSPRGSRASGSHAGDSRASCSTGERPGVGYAQSFTSSEAREKNTYSIFSLAWKRTVEMLTWMCFVSASMLARFLMFLVGIIAVLWTTVEFFHWISILGYLSSFLSKGAIVDFIAHANSSEICPPCEPQTCQEWRG